MVHKKLSRNLQENIYKKMSAKYDSNGYHENQNPDMVEIDKEPNELETFYLEENEGGEQEGPKQ